MITPRIIGFLTLVSVFTIGGSPRLLSATIGDAVDNTNLIWSTPGTNEFNGLDEVGWTGTNLVTFDGVDAAMTKATGDYQKSSLETVVTGPGHISFWWYADSEPEADYLRFFMDREQGAEAITNISDQTGWLYFSYVVPGGTHTLSWVFDKDYAGTGGTGDRCFLDQVKFKTGPGIPLATALNTSNSIALWSTGGNANPTYWEGQTNFSRMDGMAAESGAITTSQESWMETTVFGVTNVSFWWKVSSATNSGTHCWLALIVNGVTNSVISGEVGWQSKTNISIPWGTNTLRWTCFTDPNAIGKLNRGWVDEVTFSPTFAPSSNIMLSTPVVTNGVVQFTVTNKIGWPCKVYYSTNLAANEWTLLLSTNTISSATVGVTDPNAGNSPYRYYRAESP